MRRREFISLIVGVTAWPLGARAQQSAMPVIGLLDPVPAAEAIHVIAAFRRGLSEEGLRGGQKRHNRIPLYQLQTRADATGCGRCCSAQSERIFAATPEAGAAARNATTSIPIVGVDLESDPLAMGYVKSLARPGGNFTGMFLDLPELSGKQIGLLKEIVPQLSHIAVFGIPGLNAAQFAAAKTAVQALGLESEIIEVRSPDDLQGALASATTKHAEAGILLSSPLVWNSSKQISDIAIAKRLPLISLFAEFPKAGGFIAYGPNLAEIFRRSGDYVGKILHGAKPSELPIRRPEKFDLVINLKTAAALGVTVPPVLLATADEVIE
jgi:putative tryptophan/tyrosine transport system substrate-binding protein